MLLIAAAALGVGVILFQFVFVPQRSEVASLKSTYAQTARDAAFVGSALANLAPAPNTPVVEPVGSAEQISSILTDTARSSGIAISRLTRGRGETVGVVLEDVGAQSMFAWLAYLRAEYGLGVVRASVSVNETAGTLRASLEFGGGQ